MKLFSASRERRVDRGSLPVFFGAGPVFSANRRLGSGEICLGIPRDPSHPPLRLLLPSSPLLHIRSRRFNFLSFFSIILQGSHRAILIAARCVQSLVLPCVIASRSVSIDILFPSNTISLALGCAIPPIPLHTHFDQPQGHTPDDASSCPSISPSLRPSAPPTNAKLPRGRDAPILGRPKQPRYLNAKPTSLVQHAVTGGLTSYTLNSAGLREQIGARSSNLLSPPILESYVLTHHSACPQTSRIRNGFLLRTGGQCHVLHPFRRYDCGATVQTIASGVILLTRTELMERRLSVRQLPASRPAKYGLMLGSLHSGMTGDRHDAIQRTKPAHSVIAQQALGLAFLTNQGTVSNRSTMIRRGQVLLLGGFKHTLQRARAKQNTRPCRLLPLTKRVSSSGHGLITVDNDELEAAAHPPLLAVQTFLQTNSYQCETERRIASIGQILVKNLPLFSRYPPTPTDDHLTDQLVRCAPCRLPQRHKAITRRPSTPPPATAPAAGFGPVPEACADSAVVGPWATKADPIACQTFFFRACRYPQSSCIRYKQILRTDFMGRAETAPPPFVLRSSRRTLDQVALMNRARQIFLSAASSTPVSNQFMAGCTGLRDSSDDVPPGDPEDWRASERADEIGGTGGLRKDRGLPAMQRRAARSLKDTPVSAVSSYISRISITFANTDGPTAIYLTARPMPSCLCTTSGQVAEPQREFDYSCSVMSFLCGARPGISPTRMVQPSACLFGLKIRLQPIFQDFQGFQAVACRMNSNTGDTASKYSEKVWNFLLFDSSSLYAVHRIASTFIGPFHAFKPYNCQNQVENQQTFASLQTFHEQFI
ncbi:uncharacterized protein CLUP02_14782 [Colletotrichum lupini]|uniref:Uncharacterized protein n=1 Tax=Colletotrichum lupini TaxID=145971 RepID=A0A9Q8T5G1_9PEZI|nr:uncharacterized protein CLUP02_14782 [Colletotrichum lupini]UQC89253.1 hypothetical protein CLUP02_14782 [Colletotrichum lupini]